MDNYISKKRGPSGRSLFNKVLRDEKQEEIKPEGYKIDPKTGKSLDSQYSTKQVKHKEDYPTFGENEPGYEEMEEEYNRGPGFFQRIIKIFKVSPATDEEDFSEEEIINEIEEDEVKEVLRITVKWLKMLPPEEIEDIKDSQEFKRYKELLKKYNLIR